MIRGNRIYSHDGTNYYSCDIPTATGFIAKAVTYSSTTEVKTLSGTIPTGYCEPTALIRNGGVTLLRENTTDVTRSLVNDITTTYQTGWRGKNCVLSLAESSAYVSSMVGGELASPTSGWSNTTGWSTYDGSVAAVGGNIVLTATVGGYSTAALSVTTVVGASYCLQMTVSRSASGIAVGVFAGNALTASLNNLTGTIPLTSSVTPVTLTYYFTATSTTTLLQSQIISGVTTNGDTVTINSVSCKMVAVDRSLAGNHLTVNGTVTRAAVMTGSDLVGYNGFSNTSYLQAPYSSNTDFGYGDWSISAWINMNANTMYITVPNSAISAANVLPSNTGSYSVSGGNVSNTNGYLQFTGINSTGTTPTTIPTTGTYFVSVTMNGSPTQGLYLKNYTAGLNYNTTAGQLYISTPGTYTYYIYARGGDSLYVGSYSGFAGIANVTNCYVQMVAPAGIIHKSGANGSFLKLSALYTGQLQLDIGPSANSSNYSYQIVSPISALTGYNTGMWEKIDATYYSTTSKLSFRINGSEVLNTTLNSPVYLSNPNSSITIGCTYDTTGPFFGNIALPRIASAAPSTDDLTFAYNDELPLFQPNAKFLLPSTNIQGVARDPDLSEVYLSTDAGTSVMRGTVQTAIQKSVGLSGNSNHKYVTAGAGNFSIATANAVEMYSTSLPIREALARRTASPAFTPITAQDNLPASTKAILGATDISAAFIYDTSKDSDGGAWRKKVGHTSWMNETLNTATRGSRAEFPALALLVTRTGASTPGLTIYDLTDPTTPMWMTFNKTVSDTDMVGVPNTTISSIFALNGYIYFGNSYVYGHVRRIDFIGDTARSWRYLSSTNGSKGDWTGNGISDRNITTGSGFQGLDAICTIANDTVNDVAATILPLTPPNPLRFGLPNPTVAVATAGGCSVIRWDGIVRNSSSTGTFSSASFDTKGYLYLIRDGGAVSIVSPQVYQTSPFALNPADLTGLGFSYDGALIKARVLGPDVAVASYSAGTRGFSRAKFDLGNITDGTLAATITSTYNTGYKPAPISLNKLALAESSANTATLVGGTVTDRSIAAQTVNVSNTITRSLVAAGADMAAYSGFSANNYLKTATNAYDPASGDFCYMAWVNPIVTTGTQVIIDRSYYNAGYSGAGETLKSVSGAYQFVSTTYGYSNTDTATLASSVTANVWSHIVGVRRGNNLELYQNGTRINLQAMVNSNGSHTNINSNVSIGLDTSANGAYSGAIALPRISLYAPTPDQIAAIYNAELPLFQPGAKALLPSSTVQALSYCPDSDQLLVGTDKGTAIMRGLQVVDTRTANGSPSLSSDNIKVLACINGNRFIGNASEGYIELPNVGLREELQRKLPLTAYDPTRGSGYGVTTDATPTVIMNLPIQEGKSGSFVITVNGAQYGGNTAEQDVFVVEGHASRDIGGNATVNANTRSIHQITGTTAAAAAADTTNQVIKLTVTGKAATRLQWNYYFEWTDTGLMSGY